MVPLNRGSRSRRHAHIRAALARTLAPSALQTLHAAQDSTTLRLWAIFAACAVRRRSPLEAVTTLGAAGRLGPGVGLLAHAESLFTPRLAIFVEEWVALPVGASRGGSALGGGSARPVGSFGVGGSAGSLEIAGLAVDVADTMGEGLLALQPFLHNLLSSLLLAFLDRCAGGRGALQKGRRAEPEGFIAVEDVAAAEGVKHGQLALAGRGRSAVSILGALGPLPESFIVVSTQECRVVGASVQRTRTTEGVVERAFREGLHRCTPAASAVAVGVEGIERSVVMENCPKIRIKSSRNKECENDILPVP